MQSCEPESGMTQRARLVIERPAEGQFARLRAFRIVVDGVDRGRVRYGQSVEVELAPGRHSTNVAVDWLSSPTVDLKLTEGEQRRLRCGPSKIGRGVLFPPVLWVRMISERKNFLDLREA